MKIHRILSLLIISILILSYFILIIKNSVDIPNGDDLFCLMSFTQQFQDAAGWNERFRLLTEQWVEHRILYSRFAALISYWITGNVSFIIVIVIGNLFLVGLTVLFGKILKKTGHSMYYLIPVTLILFSPIMYEGNIWAGASTVYMPVCFLGLLTLYLLVYQPRMGFLVASVCALVATFSFGNGMFCYLAGAVVLIYQKRYKNLMIWTGMASLAILLYFNDFRASSATNAFSFATHFQKPAYLLYNLFGFIGGIFDFMENVNTPLIKENMPAILLGAAFTGFILYGVYQFILQIRSGNNAKENNPKLLWIGMVIFIGVTSLAMAYSRTSGESMNTLSSRYKIYSMIVFIMVYLYCLMFFKKKVFTGLFFGAASLILLVLSYYTNYQKMANYKSVFLSGLYNYNVNNHWIIYWQTSYYEGASKVLSDMIKSSKNPVYTFKEVFNELNYESLRKARINNNIKITENIDSAGTAVKSLSVYSDEYPSISNLHSGIYVVVYNKKNIMLFAANPARNGRLNMLTTGSYFKGGFTLEQDFKRHLDKGVEYNIAVFCPTEVEKIRMVNYKLKG
ncbi:hypothetical protein [Dyadobacter sp. 3J3]|uniref:hypothetical protein n=1 Tax=Dyadobacter sp. 3J3 TaxID=2606600 RepID=UPI00135843E2|nr:hypothetical protein [Dyadobacter sp. 3J3]